MKRIHLSSGQTIPPPIKGLDIGEESTPGALVGTSSNPSLREVGELFQRLVIDAHSLLPPCEMPVARMLFEEWLMTPAEKLSPLFASNDIRLPQGLGVSCGFPRWARSGA